MFILEEQEDKLANNVVMDVKKMFNNKKAKNRKINKKMKMKIPKIIIINNKKSVITMI